MDQSYEFLPSEEEEAPAPAPAPAGTGAGAQEQEVDAGIGAGTGIVSNPSMSHAEFIRKTVLLDATGQRIKRKKPKSSETRYAQFKDGKYHCHEPLCKGDATDYSKSWYSCTCSKCEWTVCKVCQTAYAGAPAKGCPPECSGCFVSSQPSSRKRLRAP